MDKKSKGRPRQQLTEAQLIKKYEDKKKDTLDRVQKYRQAKKDDPEYKQKVAKQRKDYRDDIKKQLETAFQNNPSVSSSAKERATKQSLRIQQQELEKITFLTNVRYKEENIEEPKQPEWEQKMQQKYGKNPTKAQQVDARKIKNKDTYDKYVGAIRSVATKVFSKDEAFVKELVEKVKDIFIGTIPDKENGILPFFKTKTKFLLPANIVDGFANKIIDSEIYKNTGINNHLIPFQNILSRLRTDDDKTFEQAYQQLNNITKEENQQYIDWRAQNQVKEGDEDKYINNLMEDRPQLIDLINGVQATQRQSANNLIRDKAILAVYTLQPATTRLTDYTTMKITYETNDLLLEDKTRTYNYLIIHKNEPIKYVFNTYKTRTKNPNKFKILKVMVDRDVKTYLWQHIQANNIREGMFLFGLKNNYTKQHPKTNNFGDELRDASFRAFGIRIGDQQLRISNIIFWNEKLHRKEINWGQRLEIAKLNGHGPEQIYLYYKQLFKKDPDTNINEDEPADGLDAGTRQTIENMQKESNKGKEEEDEFSQMLRMSSDTVAKTSNTDKHRLIDEIFWKVFTKQQILKGKVVKYFKTKDTYLIEYEGDIASEKLTADEVKQRIKDSPTKSKAKK